MRLRLMLPALVIVVAATTYGEAYHGLGLAFGMVAGFLCLVALLLPEAP